MTIVTPAFAAGEIDTSEDEIIELTELAELAEVAAATDKDACDVKEEILVVGSDEVLLG